MKPQSFWTYIFNLGVTDDLTKDDRKKTRLLNIISLAAFPVCIVLVVTNALEKQAILFPVYLLLALSCLAIPFINYNRKYVLGRFFLSAVATIVFSIAALQNRNGAEYFLLLNMVATVILFKNTKHIIVIAVVNAVLFLWFKIYQPTGYIEQTVEQTRLILNIGWTLLFIIIALYYYKTEHLSYHEQIETSNEQLKEQQQQLLSQKNELEQKTSQLEILNHTKGKLLSVIAHDMRTPIAGLKSSLDLYQNKVISKEEFDELAEQLTVQVDSLYRSLDNLLHWSHSQLSGIQANPELISVKPVILQPISLLLGNAKQKQLIIEQRIPDNLKVFVDPNQLRLIIRNLFSNAIKFSHTSGLIEIEAGNSDGMVEISIKDHGVGMGESSLKQLFKTETVASKRGTQNEAGTGLGLALSKEFVEKNNGKISVESEEGNGSCFTILLPSKA